MKRLAIITTHPIQYYAPVFKLLHQRKKIEIKVFYTWSQAEAGNNYDPDFKRNIKWDVPLLDGYPYIFIENVSPQPGTHHYKGIENPGLVPAVVLWKPDAIMVYGWAFKSHLNAMRYFHNKIPVIFRGDSTLLDEKNGLKKLLRTLALTWVYSKVDIGLYVGDNNKKYYLRHGKKEEKLKFVPHAVDNKHFNEKSEQYISEAKEWRSQLGIQEENIVFLFAGKLEPKKNPGLLAEVFTSLNLANTHLIMVGNGIEEQQLKATYSKIKKIHFIDFQNQSKMPVIYQICDVFVLPSQGPEETWGLALNEAMAASKPILASNKCGGAVNLVEEGKNGYIFRSNDKEDLKEKILILSGNKHQLQKMGSHSFNIVQQFTFDEICDKMENIIHKI